MTSAPAQASTPLPPPRPQDLGEAARSDPPSNDEEPASPEAAQCRARLTALGARFEARPPLRDGTCGAAEPLLLKTLPGGVEIAPPATVTCPVAEALAGWAKDVDAEAERRFGAGLKRIAIGTSYECRGQRSGNKLSEHAFANGVDVMGFQVEGRPALSVEPDPAAAAAFLFLATVRAGACAHFTTVLGPGSDAAHDDHLHLDLRGRRGGYRICQ